MKTVYWIGNAFVIIGIIMIVYNWVTYGEPWHWNGFVTFFSGFMLLAINYKDKN